MRKCILLIIIIIATNACVSAQYVTFGRAFSFGHAYITDKNASQQFLFSLTGGLSITYADNEHYGYAADIVYSTEGGKSKYNIGGADFNTKTKLSYIRMPLKYIIFLGEYGDPIRPKIIFGPSFAFLVLADTDKENTINDFNRFDMGIHFGFGANKIICDRIWLNTDITYTQGLIDITKNTNLNNEINLNGNIRLNISLLLGTNRK